MSSMKKIIVFQTWGIGDMIMTTPMLRALRQQSPEHHITVVVASPSAAAAIGGSDLCDEVRICSLHTSSIWEIFRFFLHVRAGHFDAAIIATRLSPRIALLLRALTKIAVIAGDGVGPRSWGYTHWRPVDHSKHRVMENLAILRLLYPEVPILEPYFHLDELARDEAERIWAVNRLAGGIVLGIHPGGAEIECKEKRLPVELCKTIMTEFLAALPSGRILLFFGPDDQDVQPAFKTSDTRVVSIDRVNLRTVGALIEKCHVFLNGDAGLGHIAAAVGVPVVTVAGPTDMRQTRPWGSNHSVVTTQKPLACMPCYDTELYGKCPYACECIRTIPAHEVFQKVSQALTRIIHDGSWRNRVVASRDGRVES